MAGNRIHREDGERRGRQPHPVDSFREPLWDRDLPLVAYPQPALGGADHVEIRSEAGAGVERPQRTCHSWDPVPHGDRLVRQRLALDVLEDHDLPAFEVLDDPVRLVGVVALWFEGEDLRNTGVRCVRGLIVPIGVGTSS